MKIQEFGAEFFKSNAQFPFELLVRGQQLWNNFDTQLSKFQIIYRNLMYKQFSHVQLISYYPNNQTLIGKHKRPHTFDVFIFT